LATYYFDTALSTQIPALSDSTYILDHSTWISTANGPAVYLGAGAYGNDLIIRGTLASTDSVPVLDIDAEGTSLIIDETGYISGIFAIDLTGVSTDIVNRGHIEGSNVAISLVQSAGRLVNYGVISAGVNGLAVHQSASAGTFEFENHGVLMGSGGLDLDAPEISIILGKTSRISAAIAIDINSAAGETANTINDGLISAPVLYAYRSGAGDDRLLNRGTIYGDIRFGAGNDTFIDKGVYAGRIFGGHGDDLYVLRSASTQLDEAVSTGNDTVRIGVTFTLADNIENLVLTGRRNADLIGNDDANTLKGNAGNNDLTGGLSDDILTGGGGRDLFLYAMLDGGDTITDFKQGQDRIRIEGFTQFTGFADLDISRSGKDVRISFAAENAADFILVENQKVGAFDKGDFLFA
jgi:Ca2+-binding RTX toxin-like protein